MGTSDRLLTFEQIERALGFDIGLSARPVPYIVRPDGTRSAWLSDVARANREPAYKVALRLRRAEIATLARE